MKVSIDFVSDKAWKVLAAFVQKMLVVLLIRKPTKYRVIIFGVFIINFDPHCYNNLCLCSMFIFNFRKSFIVDQQNLWINDHFKLVLRNTLKDICYCSWFTYLHSYSIHKSTHTNGLKNKIMIYSLLSILLRGKIIYNIRFPD